MRFELTDEKRINKEKKNEPSDSTVSELVSDNVNWLVLLLWSTIVILNAGRYGGLGGVGGGSSEEKKTAFTENGQHAVFTCQHRVLFKGNMIMCNS